MKEKHTYHHVDTPGQPPEALRANPYTVPDGYFEQLSDNITAKLTEQVLKTAVNDPGLVVPHDYFGESQRLLIALGKISEHDAADAGFAVPAHYFDTLPDRIRQRTQQEETPVRRLSRPKWVAYAAAASIALVLGLVGLSRMAGDTTGAERPLASVSDQQIIEYLELYGTPNDMVYISEQLDDFDGQGIGEGISEEDIEAYLNHTL